MSAPDAEHTALVMAARMVDALRAIERADLADDADSVLTYVRDCCDPEEIAAEFARFDADAWAADYAALCDEDDNADARLTGRELGVR